MKTGRARQVQARLQESSSLVGSVSRLCEDRLAQGMVAADIELVSPPKTLDEAGGGCRIELAGRAPVACATGQDEVPQSIHAGQAQRLQPVWENVIDVGPRSRRSGQVERREAVEAAPLLVAAQGVADPAHRTPPLAAGHDQRLGGRVVGHGQRRCRDSERPCRLNQAPSSFNLEGKVSSLVAKDVGRGQIPVRFFEDVRSSQRGIRATPALEALMWKASMTFAKPRRTDSSRSSSSPFSPALNPRQASRKPLEADVPCLSASLRCRAISSAKGSAISSNRITRPASGRMASRARARANLYEATFRP